MSEPSKEYIECRIFILGDEKVGKKSFVKKILNLPCTNIIHNKEAEEQYNQLLEKMKEEIEKVRIQEQQQQELLKSIKNDNKSNEEKDIEKTSRFTSTKTLFRIDEERTFSRKPSVVAGNIGDKTNRNITSTSNNIQNSKNNKIGVISSLNKNNIIREPVPEYPAKLYCVSLDKIVIKLFCIPKAEKRPFDFIPRDEDEEYNLEKEHNISFDGIRRDLNEKLSISDTVISQNKLYGFNTSVLTLFVFLYDLSDFYSFESLILYYSKIMKLYHLDEQENFKACVVGNKKDKKVMMEKEQENIYNEFFNNTQLKRFEVSTKPYFLFDKFFIDFFIQNFSGFNLNQTQQENQNKNFFEDNNFIQKFSKIIKSKSNFSRSNRRQLVSASCSPGPEYNINLYSFNSIEEIKEIFSDKKSRFNKKIFINKSGPILVKEKNEKDNEVKKKKNNIQFDIIKGGLYNKPINGFSFGIVKGKLNLLQKRKDLRQKRIMDFQENIDSYNSSPLNKKLLKESKDEEYFESALKRKNSLFESCIKEKQLKMGKIVSLHQENLKKLEIKNNFNRNRILENQRIKLNLQKSVSSPNILFNSISSLDELNKRRNLSRQRYHDVIYGKNKEHIDKYNEKLSQIRLLSSMRREPDPYLIDITENMMNPLKGRKILEKYKIIEKQQDSAPYQRIKDDFDKIAEKVSNFRPKYAERFPSEEKLRLEKEKENKSLEEYEIKDEEKRQRSQKNIENSERAMKFKLFQNDRKQKLNKHYLLLKNEEMKREAIQEIRREISIQKGYGDPSILRPINYSLVEESSPKYSIKGRYEIHQNSNDDPGNLILRSDVDMINYIKEAQKNHPLPNYDYIKPKLPGIIFNKAERFPKIKNQYEDSVLLFEDGNFQPNTHQDFICKEPMKNISKREGIISSAYEKSPSPAEYKIKSNFDIIVEEGQKISKIKDKIKMQNSMEIKKNPNLKEKEEYKSNNNTNNNLLSLK